MQIQFATFTLPAHPQSAEEEALNAFLRSHQILQCQTHFDSTQSRWCILVHHTLKKTAESKTGTSRVDYKEVLSPEDFVVFDRLRSLRKRLAEQEGIPPYVIFTNEQLAEIARQRPNSRSALQAVDGIGAGKAERYGDQFLQALVPDVPHT